jgi:menaquinone-specific isochorismate synthase
MLERALTEIESGRLSKVVVARALTAFFARAPDPVTVAMALWKENPGAYVFFFEPVPGHVLAGAAPETLATVSQGMFRATAVAGSIGAAGDPGRQAALARELLASEKDRREHQVCVKDMTTRLARISRDVRAESEPHVLTLSSIQHLETAITARLSEGETVLSALETLHPTPAVCGFPREQALPLVQELESFHRGWYAGPVGWFDGQGDGVFVPALRSAVGREREWKLFSGAGIVAGSDPEKEWEETRLKFRPVLDALSGSGRPLGGGPGVAG